MKQKAPFDSFPAHFRLMLRAMRQSKAELGGERADRDSQLASIIGDGVDWEEFLLCTRQHRVSTLVLNRLRLANGLEIPEFVMHRLTQRAAHNRLRTARLILEAKRIQKHFSATGFRTAALKGEGLSCMLYGNADARHAGDLDILVESNDLERQVELIQELGYERINPSCRMTERRLTIYRRYWKDLTFRHTIFGIEVDLHWRLFNNRCSPANRLMQWPSTEEKSHSPQAAPSLSRADQFLYCAVHGSHDAWVYLKGLADVANFLDALSESELESAFDRARELNLLPQLSSAVHLAIDWVGVEVTCPLPLPRDHSFHRAMVRTLVNRLRQYRYRPERRALPFFEEALHEWRMLPSLASLREIVERYVWRPRIWSMIDLPNSLQWAHPILGIIVPPRLGPFDAAARLSNSQTQARKSSGK